MSPFVIGFIGGTVATAVFVIVVLILIRKSAEDAVGRWFGW